MSKILVYFLVWMMSIVTLRGIIAKVGLFERGRNILNSQYYQQRTNQHHVETVDRELGSYELMLARKVPNSNLLALSHGSVYLINDASIHNDTLQRALLHCMRRSVGY